MLRIIIFIICQSLGLCVMAQDSTYKLYWNNMNLVKPGNFHTHHSEVTKKNGLYHSKAYRNSTIKSMLLSGTYKDSLLSKPEGEVVFYEDENPVRKEFWKNDHQYKQAFLYDKGNIKMEKYYSSLDTPDSIIGYYPNGQMMAIQVNDKYGNSTTNAFDQNGKRLKKFIVEQEAEYPGGSKAWMNYLAKNIRPKVPINNGAPVGRYTCIVKFVIDVDGKVIDIFPETNIGYGIEEETIRIIKQSPKWKPGIQLNEKVKAIRRQPLTFEVTN